MWDRDVDAHKYDGRGACQLEQSCPDNKCASVSTWEPGTATPHCDAHKLAFLLVKQASSVNPFVASLHPSYWRACLVAADQQSDMGPVVYTMVGASPVSRCRKHRPLTRGTGMTRVDQWRAQLNAARVCEPAMQHLLGANLRHLTLGGKEDYSLASSNLTASCSSVSHNNARVCVSQEACASEHTLPSRTHLGHGHGFWQLGGLCA